MNQSATSLLALFLDRFFQYVVSGDTYATL
jgi:hypothetical protein